MFFQMNMEFKRKLPIPLETKKMFPLTPELEKIKAERDEEIKAVFESRSEKFLLIIGPCSADREDSVMDYLHRLAKVQEKIKDKIIIIPRIYTGKPRTTGQGYMGLIHQPDPNGEPDLFEGICAVRKFHLRALSETGFTCADEMLYPENHRYLSDLLAYVAVGARSVEDQQHRLTASGLNLPVGMKNPVGGNLSSMMNAITAAQAPHDFIYRGWEVQSKGNPLAHAILRGFVDNDGISHPNCGAGDFKKVLELYSKGDFKNPAVIVDCNHANSGKQYLEQIRIANEVMDLRKENPEIAKLIKGFMIESYIEDGCQEPGGEIYGKSITDPCLGWEKTEKLIYELADKV